MLTRKRVMAVIAALLLCGPATGFAQQNATVTGVVTDESKGVLPGVTVTAIDLDSGRQIVAVTDERGEYRLVQVPPGRYSLQAELSGFGTARIASMELLVGQNANFPLTLKVGTLEETVTVTSEAPLVDVSSSEVGGNVDRRQMEELPLQGRNWMELSMMVKGITANNVGNQPGVDRDNSFQLNLDGQQITQKVAGSGFGQPKFSREAIAEFQIITNLFDITQGRSSGVQVQAITRSGTNNIDGSFYGFFRDDKFNAADPVANRVLPYQNQQYGGTFGGPIVRDKMHFFASYEYERQPETIFTRPPQLPNQSFSFDSKQTNHSLMGRVDRVMSSRDHLSIRGSWWDFENPFELGSQSHPTEAVTRTRDALNFLGSWSRVINPDMVQEVKIGYNTFNWGNLLAVPEMAQTPNYVFNGLTVGGPRNFPQEFHQDMYTARYDLSWHKGSHDFKIGGEYLGWKDTGEWHLLERGEFIFLSNPPDLERRFPADQFRNPAAWDVTGLDARVNRFDQNFGDWTVDIPRPTWAVWIGDTWRLNDRFSLNYGVRWDDDWGATAPPHVTTTVPYEPRGGVPPYDGGLAISPGDTLFRSDIRDHNNVAPRVGFNWNVTDNSDLVIRGGTGIYYSAPVSNVTFSQQSFNGQRILVNSFPNDGLPGFIQNPRRGVTNEDITSGRAPIPAQQPRVIAHDYKMPYAWQSSIGFQKQLSPVLGFEADLTHWKEYNGERGRDINMFFDPVTGYNQPVVVAGVNNRPDPKFTQIQWIESRGLADNLALSTAMTRRFANNFQAGVTYTYMFYKNDNTTGFGIGANNQFDLEDEWARSTDFQRNTFRLNGIYRLPYGISLAGAYLYGSGNYYGASIPGSPFGKPGTNRLNVGAPITVAEAAREYFDGPDVIATGAVIPRNALKGRPLHKVDLRVSKEFALPNGVRLQGIAEVFNLFNHDNFGSYNTQVTSANFSRPAQNLGNAYLPRVGQFAFRVTF
jgi:hypothetical protein